MRLLKKIISWIFLGIALYYRYGSGDQLPSVVSAPSRKTRRACPIVSDEVHVSTSWYIDAIATNIYL